MFARMSLLILCSLALAPAVLAAPETPLIEDDALQDAGLFRYWQAQLPLAPGDTPQEAHLVDEALYVVTDGGVVFALATDTGLLRWGVAVTEADYKIYAPSHLRSADGNGPVVFQTSTEVFVVDRFSGAVLQKFAPPFPAGSAAVGYVDRLFLGSSDGRFYALELDLQQRVEPFTHWQVAADGPITAAPLLDDRGVLVFASHDGRVYCCRSEDKTFVWAYSTDGPVVANPAFDDSGVYVASTNRSVYKLERHTGRLAWRARFPQPLAATPVVAGPIVFQFCPGSGLTALDSRTGEEKWRRPEARAFVAHTQGGKVLFASNGDLQIVAGETGEVRKTLTLAGSLAGTVPNVHNDAIYAIGKDGRVLCARSSAMPYLRQQQVLAARRSLREPPVDRGTAAPAPGTDETRSAKSGPDDPLRSRRDVPR